ncbi:MAG TPA: Rieske 2Fe-2S domain-containing protein, partial [Parvularculaceae bacterium]|nr:Rieske 2Fe-2S domain-containing protein [Parvularculaceae bacterium]
MNSETLDGLWYLAALSSELKPGGVSRRMMFGEPVALGRTKAGAAFALRDICPHRAAPLSAGRLCETNGAATLECPYHAWAFRVSDGVCASVPSLVSDDRRDPSTIRTRAYPLHEANGLVWIYRGEGEAETAPPDIGLDPSFKPKTVTFVEAEGPFDEAVIGLVDPAHTPTVHKQWWWREGASRHDKTKRYEPTPLGFKMLAHQPSSNTLIYKFIGGAPTTDGRRVIRGRLFRSGHHSEATDADLAALAGLPLGLIVDLRRPAERERMPSRRPAGWAAAVIEHEGPGDAVAPHLAGLMGP